MTMVKLISYLNGFDMRTFTFEKMFGGLFKGPGTVVYNDESGFGIESAYGTLRAITGTDLSISVTADKVTKVNGGTIDSFSITTTEFDVADFVGASVNAKQYFDLVAAGNPKAAAALFFAGDDFIFGTGGNDWLNGMTGNDRLNGGVGSDTLVGGLGNDQLTGRHGADVFVFDTALNSKTNVDRLLDFNSRPGQDRIQLDDDIFTRIGAVGALNANSFVKGTAAKDSNDRIIYDQASGKLWYDQDGTGAAEKVLFAVLSNHAALSASNFEIIA